MKKLISFFRSPKLAPELIALFFENKILRFKLCVLLLQTSYFRFRVDWREIRHSCSFH